MNTIQALKHFVEKDGRSFRQIEKEVDLPETTLSRIVSRGQQARDPLLSKIQEYLLLKGYELDELKNLPDVIVRLRKAVFVDNKITPKDLQKRMGYSRVAMLYMFLRGEKVSSPKIKSAELILKKVSSISEDTKTRKEPKGFEEGSVIAHLRYAVFVLKTHGVQFLDEANAEARKKLRQTIGAEDLFEATSVVCALNSEKAFERRQNTKQFK